MSRGEPERVAKRLGLTDAVICRLQARGHLQRLAVTSDELDARIYRAQLAYVNRGGAAASGDGESPGKHRFPPEPAGRPRLVAGWGQSVPCGCTDGPKA